MPWPFRAKNRTSSFPVGTYKLDAPIDGVSGLVEFSFDEYRVFGRVFEGEKDFHAPEVSFLDRPWKLMLGTVDGKIFKIAPYLEFVSKQEANPVAMATLQYCTQMLGKPSRPQVGLFCWDTSDGNTILQTAETGEGLSINLFLTSRAVREFKKRYPNAR